MIQSTLVSGGFHSGPIASLDVAAHRPLAISVGKKDGTIRIWNYVSRQCEIRWTSPEPGDPPLVAAVHPFGYFLAVGFVEKLRIYYLMMKGLKVHTEFDIYGVSLMRFANGGQLLAAAQSRYVHMISTRTMEKLFTLEHSKGNISALCFDPDDTNFWSCCSEGQVREWDPQTGERRNETSQQHCNYVATSSASGIQACCSISMMTSAGPRSFLRRLQHCEQEQEHDTPGNVKVTSLCQFAHGKSLFAGTAGGVLLIYPSCQVLSRLTEFGLHSGACGCICTSVDGRTMLTAGEDGAIFVLSVLGLASGDDNAGPAAALGTGPNDGSRVGSSEAVLILRSQMQRRLEECRRLRAENEELNRQIREEADRLEAECQAKVAEARASDVAEIQELSRRHDCIEKASTAKRRESGRIMNSMSGSHNQAAEQLGNLYDKKVEYEEDRLEALKAEKGRLDELIAQTRLELDAQRRREEEQANVELERQLADKYSEIQKHKDFVAFLQHRYDNMLHSDSEAHEGEITKANEKSAKEIKDQKEVEGKLRKEQDTLLKGLEMMEEERLRIEREQQDQQAHIRTLKDKEEELTRTLNSLKAERRERESTLSDKEQKVESYKVKVNTLKKFKHVLDKQLAEVTESLEPKEQLITQLSGHLEQLEAEYERQLTEQRAMDSELAQKKHQLMLLGQQSQDLNEVVAEKDRNITHYTHDMHSLVTTQTDLKLWPTEIRRLYHTYVCDDKAGEDRLPLENMQRQMRQGERRVTNLSAKGAQTRAKSKVDIQRKAQENAQLVNDVNTLRKDKVDLQCKAKHLKARLEELGYGGGDDATAAIGDGRPSSAKPATPPLVGSASGGAPLLPRVPSGGLPGPRQQSSTGSLHGASSERAQQRTRSVPPLGAASKHKPKPSIEDVRQMQPLLQTAQFVREHAEQQRMELSQLRQVHGERDRQVRPGRDDTRAVEEHIFAE